MSEIIRGETGGLVYVWKEVPYSNQWCYSLINQTVTLVFYGLSSDIERRTKPDALGRKPCHWTTTLKAAIVKARRAWKYSQTRCMTFLKWHTTVSMESTVSTSIRSSHAPR